MKGECVVIVYKAYKFRLYPNNNQKNLIHQTFGCTRFIYNYFLNKKDEYYEETKKNLSLSDIKKELVLLKKENNWLKEVDSMSLTTTLDNLDRAYTNFFNKKGSHPIYKKRGVKDSYKTINIRSSYQRNNYSNIILNLNDNTIKLPKLGIIPIRGYRNLDKELDIINATITKEANKYYVSLCVREKIEDKDVKLNHAIGIDLGVTSLITTSEGIKYDKLNIKRIEKHIEKLQQRLSRCVKGSNNYYKIKNRIARLYQKIRNMRKFYLHKITTKLVKENDLIVCENLETKKMIEKKESKTLTKGIVNACFSEITRELEYKTKWYFKKLIKINTYYPSSKICSHCGYRNAINDLSIREFKCINCNNFNDRDINASINILDEGIRLAIENKIITA